MIVMEAAERSTRHAFAARASLLVAGITTLALALRLFRLTFQPLWADEGYSIYFANLDLLSLTAATAADIHPPLYYYLLKLWMALFGPGEAAVRLLSVLIGVLTIPLVYVLARRLLGEPAALLSALLLALSPLHIYFSQEVRMYALAGLLATASTLLMVQVMEAEAAQRRGRDLAAPLVAYCIVTALALYTLYYAAFVPVAHVLYVVVTRRKDAGMVARWLGAAAATLLLYLPWLLIAGGALSAYVAGKVAVERYTPLDPLTFVAKVLLAFGVGLPAGSQALFGMGALVAAALAALGALRLLARGGAGQTRRRAAGTLLLTLLAAPLTLGYLVNLMWPFSPSGFARLFIFCLMPFVILLAEGVLGVFALQQPAGQAPGSLIRRSRLWLAPALALPVVLLAALANFYATPRYAEMDYRPLVRKMAALASPDDVLIALYPWQLGFVQSSFPGEQPHLEFIERADMWASYPAVMKQDLERLGQSYGRIWFITYERAGGLLEGTVAGYLAQAAFPSLADWFGDQRLYLFSWGSAGQPQPKDITIGDGLLLEAVGAGLEPVEAGRDEVRVEFRWRVTGALPAESTVTLRLADDLGRTWAQRNSAPHNGLLSFASIAPGTQVTDRHGLALPATVPPGSYRLMAGVFDPQSGANLPARSAADRDLGNEVNLGNVVVTAASRPPALAALDLPGAMNVRFAGAPSLIGWRLRNQPLRPGFPVEVDVYWQAGAAQSDDLLLSVQVRDRGNKVWGLYEGPPLGPPYPLSRWTTGQVLRGQISFLLAPDAPGGEYTISLAWLKRPGKEAAPLVNGGREVKLTTVTAVARRHVTALPRPQQPLDVHLGDAVQLLGFDLSPEQPAPGQTLQITLYWRAETRMTSGYKVFVHVATEQGVVRAQSDGPPAAGAAPTTSWLPGEVISDERAIALPGALAPGVYELRTGLYDPISGRRLNVASGAAAAGADYIGLGTITVGR